MVLDGRAGAKSQAMRDLVASDGLQGKVLVFEDVPHARVAAWMASTQLFVVPRARRAYQS